jgi:predicted ArsR family transcriptional regulator
MLPPDRAAAWQAAQAARRRETGQPKRDAILARLASGPATYAEFVALLGVSRPSVRWHLRALVADRRIHLAGWLRSPSGRDCLAWGLRGEP